MRHIFHLVPASTGVLCVLLFLLVLLGVIEVSVLSNAPWWGLALCTAISVLSLSFFGYFLYSSRCTTFEVSEEGLAIRHTLYGRTIPMSCIQVGGIRIIDLKVESEHKPKWRTNGLGLPDYSLGWFRLKNGSKALLFLTDKQRVVLLPTSKGYSVLLSPDQPEALAEALREAACPE